MGQVTAFILAGGQSRRMGCDKAFAMLEGRTLLQRALDTVRQVTPEVAIVGAKQKFAEYGLVVEDVYPDSGPLAGIHAALRASAEELNLVLAVDLAHVSSGLLRYLVERARASTAMVTLPRTLEGWQPLCAVYRKAFAEVADGALQECRNAVHALVEDSGPCVIEEAELRRQGFPAEMLRNINRPEDLG